MDRFKIRMEEKILQKLRLRRRNHVPGLPRPVRPIIFFWPTKYVSVYAPSLCAQAVRTPGSTYSTPVSGPLCPKTPEQHELFVGSRHVGLARAAALTIMQSRSPARKPYEKHLRRNPVPIQPSVVKSLAGKYFIKYECPHCSEGLRNPIEQAGSTDNCPKCRKPFIVPGAELAANLKQKLESEAREKEQKEKTKAQEIEQKEIEWRQRDIAQKMAAAKNKNRKVAINTRSSDNLLNRKDSLSWAVEFTRTYLSVILYWGIGLCLLGMVVATVVVIVTQISLPDSVDIRVRLVSVAAFAVQLIAFILLAVGVIVSIGTVAVFFEIEKNTRPMRHKSRTQGTPPPSDDDIDF
jgi:hypothetical protein